MNQSKCIGCRRDAQFVYAQPGCPVHGIETLDWNPTTDVKPVVKSAKREGGQW